VTFFFCKVKSRRNICQATTKWKRKNNVRQSFKIKMSQTSRTWSPSSWRGLPAAQQPSYANRDALENALAKVKALPPLVAVHETEALRAQLAECAANKKTRFLLQGGDCAERFDECTARNVESKLKILLQMSLIVTHGARVPTVRIGRLAGQFAKPRSKGTELIDGIEFPSYRGDNVNGFALEDREPDPKRLVEGYFHSAATMNYARVAIAEGLADLRHAKAWDMGFVKNEIRRREYEGLAEQITSAMNFIETCGVKLDPLLKSVDLFTSHEGLHLEYEEAMTKKHADGNFYNTGAHFLWIGDRTRQLDHAHLEYFRGIANPIGIKVGPSMSSEELVQVIEFLWHSPEENPGKITLITRFGAQKVSTMLPPLIRAVQDANLHVVWICDPCHGNTTTSDQGLKTRDFDAILNELETCIRVHDENNSFLGGVHFELTGDNVSECTGGPQSLTARDLPQRYTTLCDPRLNYAQSVEMAFRLTESLKKKEKTLIN